MALCGILLQADGEKDAWEDRFIGTWGAENVFVNIWREDGEIQCIALFGEGAGETDYWEYGGCWYEAEDDALWCGSVTRTRERYDSERCEMVEIDWSLNDMIFAEFAYSDYGTLIGTDDAMEMPVELERRAE